MATLAAAPAWVVTTGGVEGATLAAVATLAMAPMLTVTAAGMKKMAVTAVSMVPAQAVAASGMERMALTAVAAVPTLTVAIAGMMKTALTVVVAAFTVVVAALTVVVAVPAQGMVATGMKRTAPRVKVQLHISVLRAIASSAEVEQRRTNLRSASHLRLRRGHLLTPHHPCTRSNMTHAAARGGCARLAASECNMRAGGCQHTWLDADMACSDVHATYGMYWL